MTGLAQLLNRAQLKNTLYDVHSALGRQCLRRFLGDHRPKLGIRTLAVYLKDKRLSLIRNYSPGEEFASSEALPRAQSWLGINAVLFPTSSRTVRLPINSGFERRRFSAGNQKTLPQALERTVSLTV